MQVVLLYCALQGMAAAEISTLFTTPQERQIINSNRYKSDDAAPVRPVEVEVVDDTPVQLLVQEEVVLQYRISGISISQDGPHTVWINSTIYEDGEQLEDNSRIKVLTGDEIRVRITAPDGKHHYATSGQTVEVSYLATVEN